MSPPAPPFFWLHVKKCGGGSIRRALAPHYVLAERVRKPVNFIQSPPVQWNDILNNFRVPLGAYQFRRCAFARRFLWPESWDGMLRFGFCRHPVDRAVSAFHYLARPRGGERSFVQHLAETGPPPPDDPAALFDAFLDLVAQARASDSIYRPVNLHFTTHTAPVWDDVTDDQGRLLLSHLYRLEDLGPALAEVRAQLGLPAPESPALPLQNARDSAEAYCPTPVQRTRIETLWPRDAALYEDAARPAD